MPNENSNQNTATTELKGVAEQLYKQNLELAVKNKTLTLLRELYQISIQTLGPEELSNRLTKLIQESLEFGLVTIYTYSQETHLHKPLGSSVSQELVDSWYNISNRSFVAPQIKEISEDTRLNFLLHNEPRIINGLVGLWSDLSLEQYKKIEDSGHVKSSIVYPLVIEGESVGIILMCLNRTYEELSRFEQESISNVVNVVAVALDRSLLDRKLQVANEKLKELDRRKTEFVSIASHQLRSPLTAIKGYSSMILEGSFGETSDRVKQAVDVIFQSSNRLVNVIEDFLNITRIELGKMKYELSEFNIKDLSQEVINELKPEAEKKQLDLTITSDTGPHLVYGDTGKIRQVISNMIDNSLKYTPTGSIKLEVAHTGNKVRVQVTDTGVGLAPGEEEKLFQKFVRAEGAGKVNIKGTGLGMYVARQIVEAHLGKIYAKSPGKGKGSTFVVEFPDSNNVNRNQVGKVSTPPQNA